MAGGASWWQGPTTVSDNPYARPLRAASSETVSDAPSTSTRKTSTRIEALELHSSADPAGSLVVVRVSVRYGLVVAIDDASVIVEPGMILAVTGPSGAGKSSLLWAMAGAVSLAAGEVRVGRQAIVDRQGAIDAGVALIPQGNGLAGVLTAQENVVFPLLAQGIGAEEAARRATQSLADVGLQDSGNHLVEELSGGQQQRVAVARGLATRADILLADEPTSELDHGNRGLVLDLLRAEAGRGTAVVLATHDPDAAAVADAEIRLDEGRLTKLR
jgi:putative ABC transport system ATP-binding protein